MIGESALCLALDRDRLPDRAGVLAPRSPHISHDPLGCDQETRSSASRPASGMTGS
jgi:hypothetical protein